MCTQTSMIKRKLRGLAWRVFNTIENNGNARFEENGEKVFIGNLLETFKANGRGKIVFNVGANIDSHSSLMELYKFFKDRNFSVAKMMPNGIELRSYGSYMDNFNYSNYVAITNKIL